MTTMIQHENRFTKFFSSVWSWLKTTNHKEIGILYIVSSMVFFLIGGFESLIIRQQLGQPNNTYLSAEAYNQVFTMHGTTMIFLFAMPILVGFGNYIVPLMIGARDMAFPRLNGLSFWLFILGGILLYSSFIFGGAPDAGWVAYAPLTVSQYSPTRGLDFWVLGIFMTGVASTAGAINFIVTILNMRAPGMGLFRMPLFIWQMLVTSFLIVFAMPSLTVDAILLFLQRNYGAVFFSVSQGGDPLLWQHLFWFFGHPEVYILILPAFGVISEVIPVFSRKPIFGYGALAYSGIAIGFLGFTVWAHHMFTVGLSPVADAIFSVDSLVIAVPTSIKIFNWLATMWGGKINLKSPMLFAIGFISMFVIGGLSGISLALVPIDFQMQDSYYVVAHLHYVLFGGTVYAIFAGIYYWFPKFTGKLLSEKLGKWHFWMMFAGFNLTFFPMHALGILGMPRRIYTYSPEQGWTSWNIIVGIGAIFLTISILIFLWNFFASLKSGKKADADPWDAQTLEWTISSPPPEENFPRIPVVHSRRPLWDLKHPQAGKNPGITYQEDEVETEIHSQVHLPVRSIYPFLLSFGVFVAAYGLMFSIWLIVLGLIFLFAGIIGWVLQPLYASTSGKE
jgi:cytochrome c oxidase subunit 1